MNFEQFLKIGSILSLNEEQLLIGIGSRSWLPKPGIFYFPDFFLSKEASWCQHDEVVVVSKLEFIDLLSKIHEDQVPPIWRQPDSRAFVDAFSDIKNHGLEKLVPYVTTTTHDKMTQSRLCHTLIHAISNSVNQTVYGYWSEQGGMIGVTPESLFTLKGNLLETMAVAGTALRERDANDFLQDPKERKEHNLVIDGIVESLKNFGDVRVGVTEVLELKDLSHLKTNIFLELKDIVDLNQIIRALHPTPALGTYPKNKGTEWLAQYNLRQPRMCYGAPIACLYQGEVRCFVAIRNVQWTPRAMAIIAGCGVVQESLMENEWKEVLLKTESVKKNLGFQTLSLPQPVLAMQTMLV